MPFATLIKTISFAIKSGCIQSCASFVDGKGPSPGRYLPPLIPKRLAAVEEVRESPVQAPPSVICFLSMVSRLADGLVFSQRDQKQA